MVEARLADPVARLQQVLDAGPLRALVESVDEAAPPPGRLAPLVDRLDAQDQPLAALLLLGRPVELAGVDDRTAALGEALVEQGLCVADGGWLQSSGWVATRIEGLWALVSPPTAFENDYYHGEDSRRLARLLEVPPGARCLDLCAGTGLQAMVMARQGGTVDAVEISAGACAAAQVAVRVNDLEHLVTVHPPGDLYDALPPGGRYDRVVANVPFLPGRSTGTDGFDVGRRVLDRLPEHLLDTGEAWITALVTVTEDGVLQPPSGFERLVAETGRTLTWHLGSTWSVAPDGVVVQAIADDTAGPSQDVEQVADDVARRFEERGAVAAHDAVAHVSAVPSRPDER